MDNVIANLDEAIEQFNQQEFYTCHDLLEAIWMEAKYPEKTFYQGLLQIAVGLYHLGNSLQDVSLRNWNGSKILLGEGISRLRDFQPEFEGIDVSHLVQDSFRLLSILQKSDEEELKSLNIELPMILRCSTQL